MGRWMGYAHGPENTNVFDFGHQEREQREKLPDTLALLTEFAEDTVPPGEENLISDMEDSDDAMSAGDPKPLAATPPPLKINTVPLKSATKEKPGNQSTGTGIVHTKCLPSLARAVYLRVCHRGLCSKGVCWKSMF